MNSRGAFGLKSASDLREKLRQDFAALKANPFSPYLGFNFFVTAEHLLDWQFPGFGNKAVRTAERQANVLLQITSHIANGAKHFVTEGKHHQSVRGTRNQLGYFGNYFGNWFGSYFGRVGLRIELDGAAALKYEETIGAVALADNVLAYWDSQAL